MKGTRRHELEQNELADWIGQHVQMVKPYANAILGAILLTVVIVVGYNWWSGQTVASSSESWGEFYAAMSSGNPADLDAIVEAHPGTEVANWAAVTAGDIYLAFGCSQRFSSLAGANQELGKAIANYMVVLDSTKLSVLRERATFGLARARETLGELQKATEEYEKVVKGWPDGIYSGMAAQRIEDLKLPVTKEFYDRFAKFDPKPQFTDEPGTPGERPAFDLDSLPEETKSLVDPLMPKLDDAKKAETPKKNG